MRKLYWWCLGGGVLLLAGVFTAALVAVSYPESFAGRAALAASQVAASVNPLGQCGRGCGCPQEPASVEEGPAEVCEAGGEEPRRPFEFGVVAEPAPAPPITIPEDEPIPPVAMPVGDDASCPLRAEELGIAGVECPRGEHAEAAPPTMPYCEEACEAQPARLHMPRAEADEEEQEEAGDEPCPLGGVHRMLRLFEQLLKRDAGAPRPESDE